jgi:hypothetical protein
MTIAHYDIIGVVGGIAFVVAYFGNVGGWLAANRLPYLLLNLAGAGFILYSLFWEWNFSAAFIEIFWIAITLYGLGRYFFRSQASS